MGGSYVQGRQVWPRGRYSWGKQLGTSGDSCCQGWDLEDWLGLKVGCVGKPQIYRVGKGQEVPSPARVMSGDSKQARGNRAFLGAGLTMGVTSWPTQESQREVMPEP